MGDDAVDKVAVGGFEFEDICGIRWHGRGGQGAVSSAKILAAAAYHAGFDGVTSAPSFGAERRGAPVTASTRIAHETIRIVSQPENPHIVVVLDDTLIESGNTMAGLRPGGWMIINSRQGPEAFQPDVECHVATADATGAAEEAGLLVQGTAMVNTPMLGAIARATGLVALKDIEAVMADSFSPKAAKINCEAARICYERCRCLVPA